MEAQSAQKTTNRLQLVMNQVETPLDLKSHRHMSAKMSSVWFGHVLCTACIFVMAVELTLALFFCTFLTFCLVAYVWVLCLYIGECYFALLCIRVAHTLTHATVEPEMRQKKGNSSVTWRKILGGGSMILLSKGGVQLTRRAMFLLSKGGVH